MFRVCSILGLYTKNMFTCLEEAPACVHGSLVTSWTPLRITRRRDSKDDARDLVNIKDGPASKPVEPIYV